MTTRYERLSASTIFGMTGPDFKRYNSLLNAANKIDKIVILRYVKTVEQGDTMYVAVENVDYFLMEQWQLDLHGSNLEGFVDDAGLDDSDWEHVERVVL